MQIDLANPINEPSATRGIYLYIIQRGQGAWQGQGGLAEGAHAHLSKPLLFDKRFLFALSNCDNFFNQNRFQRPGRGHSPPLRRHRHHHHHLLAKCVWAKFCLITILTLCLTTFDFLLLRECVNLSAYVIQFNGNGILFDSQSGFAVCRSVRL